MSHPTYKTLRDNTGKIDHIETNLSGSALLKTPLLNKGSAFTQLERQAFNLIGLLPTHIESLEQQKERMYAQYQEHLTPLARNIYLNRLHEDNEILFYYLVSQHLEEMLPIIYTPTVGEIVKHFSLEYRRAKGIYIRYEDKDKISEILDSCAPPAVDLTVVTDGEGVLGLGDQGIGGVHISIAKLMVYTLCGGIHPGRVLPIQLDVGTNNPLLLNDPLYLGWRHERITGAAYDGFIEAFVQAITKKFPHIFLHWEDLGRNNARRILNHYQHKICTFNGDMQGTGAVTLAAILAAVKKSYVPLTQHRIAILGAGTAGTGIADQTYDALLRAGLTPEEARARFWLIDKPGLLTQDMTLMPDQKPYARDEKSMSLAEVIKYAKPTILIGCSTVAGAFTENIVKMMAENTERPIIMPLTNPTILAEAKPEDLINWTEGKAIVATGSPFAPVKYAEKWFQIAQCNNALAFPGIGLGAILAKAKHVSDDMIWAAANALSEYAAAANDECPLLPPLMNARKASMRVALAVAEQARAEGLAQISETENLRELINLNAWDPVYYPYKKA